MSQFYYITLQAHVETTTDDGKAFCEKIKTEVKELREMNVDPFFTCEDDGQGFTNISLYFGDTFSGMVDSYYFDIMQELNAIGNGSYGCLMCDNEYGVTVWKAFGASKFEEISSDDSSLEGVWGTVGNGWSVLPFA